MNGDNQCERDRVMRCYRIAFADRIQNDPEFKRRVEELRGKTLGCFCKPKDCHGDIIASWLDHGTVGHHSYGYEEQSPCMNPFVDVPMNRQHTI